MAEAESSCVVYGMPKSAVELGCVDVVLPVQDMAAVIKQHYGI
jgi:two-component system chemotaxis response regulator CheB